MSILLGINYNWNDANRCISERYLYLFTFSFRFWYSLQFHVICFCCIYTIRKVVYTKLVDGLNRQKRVTNNINRRDYVHFVSNVSSVTTSSIFKSIPNKSHLSFFHIQNHFRKLAKPISNNSCINRINESEAARAGKRRRKKKSLNDGHIRV